jgi:hypothetical protein
MASANVLLGFAQNQLTSGWNWAITISELPLPWVGKHVTATVGTGLTVVVVVVAAMVDIMSQGELTAQPIFVVPDTMVVDIPACQVPQVQYP